MIYPSESVFALGGNPFSPPVLASIKNYKHCKLSPRKGFILLVSDVASLKKWGELSIEDYENIRSFVPKNRALTFVIKSKPLLPKALCYQSKVAIRVVEHTFLKALVSLLPFPLISTSLNPPKKQPTKSITKARVYARRHGLNAVVIPHTIFTNEQTSRIYDAVNHKWLR